MPRPLLDQRSLPWRYRDGRVGRFTMICTDRFDNVKREVAQVRAWYPDAPADAYDPDSYHLIGLLDGEPLVAIRATYSADREIENVDFYAAEVLARVAPHYSSGGRYFAMPNISVPADVRAAFRARYIELVLQLGSLLDVSNCHARGVRYYERMGWIVDDRAAFTHPTMNTPSFPMYIPACPIRESIVKPLMKHARHTFYAGELRALLAEAHGNVQSSVA
ncbi:MAG: hypothetical protein AAF414_17420 [Pseudomonadota bacterium]